MKFIKTKLVLIFIFLLSIVFFSNDFGIIDIEQTAIITALALDYENNEYSVTAQIAVPEATDVNSENTKTQITTKGETIASAIKRIGSATGWFPQLYFCNLLILGQELANENTMKILDYFSMTLRVQDSAIVVLCDGKAKDVLEYSSPLDSISSFAIQKVILKEDGFDNDIMIKNIKDFASEYYSFSSSSYMPILTAKEQSGSSSGGQSGGSGGSSGQGGGSGGSSGSSSSQQKEYVFDAQKTALFNKGVKIGELDKEQTFTYNLISSSCEGSEIVAKDVMMNGSKRNVLTLVKSNKRNRYIMVDNDRLVYNVDLSLKLKISDQTSDNSDTYFAKNLPIPDEIKQAIKQKVTDNILSLIQKEKECQCDFLKITSNLYRFHTNYFDLYKGDIYTPLQANINVTIE